jgi:hypothetical protein
MREQITQEFTQHMVIHSLAFDAENFMRSQVEQFFKQMDDGNLMHFIDLNRNGKLNRFWENVAKEIGDTIYNRNKVNALSTFDIQVIIQTNLMAKLHPSQMNESVSNLSWSDPLHAVIN